MDIHPPKGFNLFFGTSGMGTKPQFTDQHAVPEHFRQTWNEFPAANEAVPFACIFSPFKDNNDGDEGDPERWNTASSPQETLNEEHLEQVAVKRTVYVFVIDTALPDDELNALKKSLKDQLHQLPTDQAVGLVTFDSNVTVHDLGKTPIRTGVVITGTHKIEASNFTRLITNHGSSILQQISMINMIQNSSVVRSFVKPLGSCLNELNLSIDLLRSAPTIGRQYRPRRALGCALSCAKELINFHTEYDGGRIVCLLGGPCTVGPGKVAETELKHPIRSWSDIRRGKAPLVSEAERFYASLVAQLHNSNISMDLFASSLNQVGLHEMARGLNALGGHIVLADSFNTELFRQSFRKLFSAESKCLYAHDVNFEVLTSDGFTLTEVVGLKLHGKKFKVASAGSNDNFTLVFDKTDAQPPPPAFHAQISVTYTDLLARQRKLRRFTLTAPLSTSVYRPLMDSECAAVFVARSLAQNVNENVSSGVKCVDNIAIRQYKHCQGNNAFFRYLYHLRRSQFVQNACSPDESAFYRHHLLTADPDECIKMIEPIMYRYAIREPPQIVPLDTSSLTPDTVVVMDDFFRIVICRGKTVAAWRDGGLHEQPENGDIQRILDDPIQDSLAILRDRFPVPRFVDCDFGGSQARFILAKVNPSSTQKNTMITNDSTAVLTDDVSFQTYLSYIQRSASNYE